MSSPTHANQEKNCEKCNTLLIAKEITSTWNDKTTKKLQWQNKLDSKPHFKFVSDGKYDCNKPKPKPEEKPSTNTKTLENLDPLSEAELIVRWACEKAYKITMQEETDYSKIPEEKRKELRQKEAHLTKVLALTASNRLDAQMLRQFEKERAEREQAQKEKKTD